MLTRTPSTPQANAKNAAIYAPTPVQPIAPAMAPQNEPASQYTILEKLGTGSFGTVYKGMHNETKQIVAIKQIGEDPSFTLSGRTG